MPDSVECCRITRISRLLSSQSNGVESVECCRMPDSVECCRISRWLSNAGLCRVVSNQSNHSNAVECQTQSNGVEAVECCRMPDSVEWCRLSRRHRAGARPSRTSVMTRRSYSEKPSTVAAGRLNRETLRSSLSKEIRSTALR
jgi:hypothetical protein